MVERVRITPEQIITRDSGNNITFNTDYAYLKTGSGTLYAGGYQRAPAIYGEDSITDHTAPGEGWYTSELKAGTSFYPTSTGSYTWNVPEAGQVQFLVPPNGFAQQSAGYVFMSPNLRSVQYVNYDTGSTSNMGITYRWAIGYWAYDIDSEGSYTRYQYEIYPVFSSNSFPAVTNPSGGYYSLAYSAGEYGDFSRTQSGYDEYGQPYSYTQYGSNTYTARTVSGSDGYGSSYTYNVPAQTIYWRNNGFFTKKDPIALSLAVTA